MKVYDLEERTAKFAELIIDICKSTPKNVITLPIINQLIRSSTSIGANYCEANGASSTKDFRNKIFICKKEAKETNHWIRMLFKATDKNVAKNEIQEEIRELILIFSKIASKVN